MTSTTRPASTSRTTASDLTNRVSCTPVAPLTCHVVIVLKMGSMLSVATADRKIPMRMTHTLVSSSSSSSSPSLSSSSPLSSLASQAVVYFGALSLVLLAQLCNGNNSTSDKHHKLFTHLCPLFLNINQRFAPVYSAHIIARIHRRRPRVQAASRRATLTSCLSSTRRPAPRPRTARCGSSCVRSWLVSTSTRAMRGCASSGTASTCPRSPWIGSSTRRSSWTSCPRNKRRPPPRLNSSVG